MLDVKRKCSFRTITILTLTTHVPRNITDANKLHQTSVYLHANEGEGKSKLTQLIKIMLNLFLFFSFST